MNPYATALIDMKALQHNFHRVRECAPSQKIIAMVKANAYGHGLCEVGAHLKEADAFGVARLEEALTLKKVIRETQPILIMSGLLRKEEYVCAAEEGFHVVFHEKLHWDIVKEMNFKTPLSIWLKVDTGMHRLGVPPKEVVPLWEEFQKAPHCVKRMGIMTHFAQESSPQAEAQIECFQKATGSLKGPFSLANSACILRRPATHGDWVRPGIMLYGSSPFSNTTTGLEEGLKPVMTLKSILIAVHPLKKGDPIGYDGIWQCPEDMLVGVVALGYGDGYPRHIEPETPILIHGQRVPIVGRVSMDMITVDLRTMPQAQVGDEVIAWGEGLPVEIIARSAKTIGYELLCQVTPRVKKEYAY